VITEVGHEKVLKRQTVKTEKIHWHSLYSGRIWYNDYIITIWYGACSKISIIGINNQWRLALHVFSIIVHTKFSQKVSRLVALNVRVNY